MTGAGPRPVSGPDLDPDQIMDRNRGNTDTTGQIKPDNTGETRLAKQTRTDLTEEDGAGQTDS